MGDKRIQMKTLFITVAIAIVAAAVVIGAPTEEAFKGEPLDGPAVDQMFVQDETAELEAQTKKLPRGSYDEGKEVMLDLIEANSEAEDRTPSAPIARGVTDGDFFKGLDDRVAKAQGKKSTPESVVPEQVETKASTKSSAKAGTPSPPISDHSSVGPQKATTVIASLVVGLGA